MKFKRSLSILLMLTVVLSTITFAIPTYAKTEEKPFIDYIWYEDFSSDTLSTAYFGGTLYNSTTQINDGTSLMSGYALTDDNTLKMTGASQYAYFITPWKTLTDKPKLYVSYRVKTDKPTKNRWGNREGYGLTTVFGRWDGNIYTDQDTTAEEDKVGSFSANEWVTVTCVYDNDISSKKRDIYINGELKKTADISAKVTGDYIYSTSGKYQFTFMTYGSSFVTELDDFMVYAYPEKLDYEISSASGNEIVLTFNMIPNIDTVIKNNFAVNSGNITKVEKSIKDPRQVILTLDETLLPGAEYSVTVSNITAGKATAVGGYLTIDQKDLTFETKPYKVYAENLKLYNGADEVTSLTDGTYKVKTNFINESEQNLTPVIAAGLYDQNNELKNLQLIPVSDPTLPIEEDITLSGTSGLTLKLFMLKSKTSPETVSNVSVYTESNAVTGGAFDSQIKIIRDTFNIGTVVNGDTQVITTKVDTFTNEMARPATLIVLKKGKTLSDIDLSNPMATVVALDSINLTESGMSYKIADVKDDYEAYIYFKNSNNFGYKTFTYYGKAYMDEGKDIIKDIEKEEVDTFISNYKDAINLDTSIYDTLKDGTGSAGEVNEKAMVAESIEAQREEKDTKEFASFEEFIEAYNTALELVLTKTDADVINIINKLAPSEVTTLYKETISDEAVNAVYADLKANKPLTMNEFEKAFNKNVILKGIEKEENYTQTQTIIENTTSITGIDLSVYNTLNETKPVIEALSKKSFANYGLLKSAFDAAVTTRKTVESNTVILPPNTQTPSVSFGGGGGGTAVIPSPMEKTEIAVDPEPTEEPIVPTFGFTDLSGFDWAKDAINNLYDKGIVNGVSKSAYNPSGDVKREEFVKMIDTLYSAESTTSTFTDVNQSEWYALYINKAVTAGIIKGMNENTFGLGQGVTREDMAVMIVRALKLETNITGETFSDDSSIADYAKEAVYTLKNKGIISGTGNGNYEPKRVMTRAEAAVLINNILNIVD